MTISDKFFLYLSEYWSIHGYNGTSTAKFYLTFDGRKAAEICLMQGPDDEYYLDGLDVKPPYRGKGYMSRALGELTAHADKQGLRLSLLVADFEGVIGEEKLIEVYSRFGFEITKHSQDNGETEMLRIPRHAKGSP